MNGLKLLLISFLFLGFLHMASSKIGPLVKLSQQKGGDVRRDRHSSPPNQLPSTTANSRV
ncbi:unnamed protein product [Cylicocyclus nassatus]|uniref:Transmembrane protein n=1 Tax=Cylicocyclus nassatus TaxID=53992 RepID=A0AA36GE55_CYLNA|nr:unnamed protein product [Cylicocyclus nassatus]